MSHGIIFIPRKGNVFIIVDIRICSYQVILTRVCSLVPRVYSFGMQLWVVCRIIIQFSSCSRLMLGWRQRFYYISFRFISFYYSFSSDCNRLVVGFILFVVLDSACLEVYISLEVWGFWFRIHTPFQFNYIILFRI